MTTNRQQHNLKIIVTSTPKTGNNWVKQLLAATYHLPMHTLTEPFTAGEVDKLGDRWIAHQHYYPVMDLLEWAEQNDAIFVTTTRHPGDALISLYHHIRNHRQRAGDDLGMAAIMAQDKKRPRGFTAQYVRKEYYYALNVSIAWIRSGLSLVVRYEDLWRDPVAALTALTEEIATVDQDRIKRAVAQCQIGMLRRLHDPRGQFFRKGSIGGWSLELPEEIQDLFRNLEPYPSQFAALGYSLDPSDPLMSAPARPFEFQSPLDSVTEFENGVRIPPIVEKLYLSLDADVTRRWDPIERTSGPGSFYDWLNAPADSDPHRETAAPVITNLATYVYSTRKDLQLQYPDIYGQNRIGYAHWFAMAGRDIYALDKAFVLPILLSWSGTRLALRPEGTPRRTSVTTRAQTTGLTRPTSLDYIQATSAVHIPRPMAWPAWPKGLRPKIVALAQRMMGRLLHWYVNPIVEQQNRFNKAVVGSLDTVWQQAAKGQEKQPRPDVESETGGE
jgi:hypothetical protein